MKKYRNSGLKLTFHVNLKKAPLVILVFLFLLKKGSSMIKIKN